MDSNKFFYIIIMSLVSIIIVEGFKKICRPNNDLIRSTVYSLVALIPSGLLGLVITKLFYSGDNWIYDVIANGCIIYVIQYIFGISLIAKFKESITKKMEKL